MFNKIIFFITRKMIMIVERNVEEVRDTYSSNGVWSSRDSKTATRELGEKMTNKQVDSAVSFIEAWKPAKN
jgi:creatinine amidohydrolase/Fe(II)-dependent formamide hydrolase-like protein